MNYIIKGDKTNRVGYPIIYRYPYISYKMFQTDSVRGTIDT